MTSMLKASQESIYNRAIIALLADSKEDAIMQAICWDEISKVARSSISTEIVFSTPEKDKARTLAATFGVSENLEDFSNILSACHIFNVTLEKCKALERRLFHISAPAPVTLQAAELIQGNHNHSILRHSARPPRDLVILCKAFNPDAPRHIIPLDPKRLALHNLTRRFLMDFSLQGELSAELNKVVPSLVEHFFPEDRCKTCDEMRSRCYDAALEHLKTGTKVDMEKDFFESINALRKQTDSGKLTPEEINKALAMRVADLIVESYVKEEVEKLDLATAPVLQHYDRLPTQTKTTRRTFMINGGVASGKSSSQAIQASEAAEEGVEWKAVLTINRDAYKPMLLKREDVDSEFQEFFASYTEDEAFMLRDAILGEYRERLKSDKAPHLYVDQVMPNADMLELAGDPEGLGIDVTIVQTPVEKSFRMAHARSVETGYHAVTAGVLSTHAGVPQKLLDSIATARRKGKVNVRIKIVNNVAPGHVQLVAKINLCSKTGKVADKNQLLTFFSKSKINTKATKFSELYPEDIKDLMNFEPMATLFTKDITLLT